MSMGLLPGNNGLVKFGKKAPVCPAPVPCDGEWAAPSDWDFDTNMAMLLDSENGFVIPCAVFPDITTKIKIGINVSATGGSIDYDDGNTASITATTQSFSHDYDYDSMSQTPTSDGFKIAWIVLKSTGNLTGLQLNTSDYTTGNTKRGTNFLALKLRSQASSVALSPQNPHNQLMMQYVNFGDTPINPYVLMRYMTAVKKLIMTTFDTSTNASYMFNFSAVGSTDFDFNSLDYSSITNFTQAFASMYGGVGKTFERSIAAATSMASMFNQCEVFRRVLVTDTDNVTDISYAIYGSTVMQFEMDDASSVTTTSNFIHTASTWNPLEKLILPGLPVGIDLTNGQMDATAIDAFFTALGTASGSQTITVTGNPGAATCNTAIATAKGFTVVTA